jgi:pantoate--beta-alanine ligase
LKVVRRAVDLPRYPSSRIGFVPTMGAFHEGHLSLMRIAKEECDKVVVSLFVNPLQFGPNEDLARYPRNEEADAEMARKQGVDILFVPSVEEIYPRESTLLRVPAVTDLWEGAARPGHFDGVATVVCKLFHMVNPHVAYFGLKDLQQCQVIRRMAEDLNMRITLRLLPTVREKDGLAMSSRNRYLSEEHRQLAPELYRSLESLRNRIAENPEIVDEDELLECASSELTSRGFLVDYLSLVSLPDMLPIKVPTSESAIIVAAKLGHTRLIDNVLIP